MTDNADLINIAIDFSAYPAGRDDQDGPFNGSTFRKEILLPKLHKAIHEGRILVVSLDGVKSFGSSFLEEAFGGLVRQGVAKADIKKHLEIRTSVVGGARYLSAIQRYIERARQA